MTSASTRSSLTAADAENRPAVMPDALSTELLFCGAKEIVIHHQGEDYRLRITKNDKLILTK